MILYYFASFNVSEHSLNNAQPNRGQIWCDIYCSVKQHQDNYIEMHFNQKDLSLRLWKKGVQGYMFKWKYST